MGKNIWGPARDKRLGMGCWAIGGPFWAGEQPLGWGEVDDATSTRAIHAALEAGITYFDTANVYGAGHSERVLGAALKGRPEAVLVSTKFTALFDEKTRQVTGADFSADGARAAVEASRRRLGRDVLDMVFLHENHAPIEEARPAMDALEEMRAAGIIRAFGWSTDDPARARAFAGMEGFRAVQHDLNLFAQNDEMLKVAAEFGVAAVNRQPLAMGLLSGRAGGFSDSDIRGRGPDWLRYFVDGKPAPEMAVKLAALRGLLMVDGRSLVQGALCWILAISPLTVPIPGFRTPEQVIENAGALEFGPLPGDVMAEIAAILKS